MKRQPFSMRRTCITAVILLVVFFLVRAPASLFTVFLPPSVDLKHVEGSVWHGKAAAVGVGGVLVQEGVEWRFLPASLSGAALEWAFTGRFADRPSRLNLVARPSGVEVRGLDLVAPLEPFAALHPKLKSVQLGGTLHAKAGGSATIAVDIRRVFSALMPRAGFGDYRLEIDTGPGGAGKWRLTTMAGKLRVEGEGAVGAAPSAIKGRVVITPQESPSAIASMLAAFAREGTGYRIEF